MRCSRHITRRTRKNSRRSGAPCSASGTIRRHPDLLALKSAADVARLAAAQLAPGGVLVYCTCSLQKAEGEEQIATLLARALDVRRLPISAAEIDGLAEAITAEGDVRLLPYHLAMHGGLDEFFMTRLVHKLED